jgi:hypothetical protein
MRLHRIAQQGQDSEVWLCEADPCTHESILLDNDDNQATRRLYTSVVRADCTIVGWVEHAAVSGREGSGLGSAVGRVELRPRERQSRSGAQAASPRHAGR